MPVVVDELSPFEHPDGINELLFLTVAHFHGITDTSLAPRALLLYLKLLY